jgi:hypothetical protein
MHAACCQAKCFVFFKKKVYIFYMNNKININLEVEANHAVSLFNMAREQPTREDLSDAVWVSIQGVSIKSSMISDQSYSEILALSQERAIEEVQQDRDSMRNKLIKRMNRIAERLKKLS